MTLTVSDITNKKFMPVRLRDGYDMGQVDDFLDEVEETVRMLEGQRDQAAAAVAERDQRLSTVAGEAEELRGLVESLREESARQPAVDPDQLQQAQMAHAAAVAALEQTQEDLDRLRHEHAEVVSTLEGARIETDRLRAEVAAAQDAATQAAGAGVVDAAQQAETQAAHEAEVESLRAEIAQLRAQVEGGGEADEDVDGEAARQTAQQAEVEAAHQAEVESLRAELATAKAEAENLTAELAAHLTAAQDASEDSGHPTEAAADAVDVNAADRAFASKAAVRLLELATLNAEQLREEAEAYRDQVISEAETAKVKVEARVRELVEFEEQYRSNLIGYVRGHLDTLAHAVDDAAPRDQGGPSELDDQSFAQEAGPEDGDNTEGGDNTEVSAEGTAAEQTPVDEGDFARAAEMFADTLDEGIVEHSERDPQG